MGKYSLDIFVDKSDVSILPMKLLIKKKRHNFLSRNPLIIFKL
jgi:hypothetical protein